MIICLAVGNTHIYGGVFDNEQLKLQFRHAVYRGISSDQLGLFLRQVLQENQINLEAIEHIACCSVTPYLDYPLRSACIKYFKQQPFILKPGVKTGLKIKYKNPTEVGSDRIANAIAGINCFPNKPLLIVEFGATATVLCVINQKQEYLGGCILPGISLAMDSLQQQAAKLPPVEILKPEQVIGQSAIQGIQSGLYYGQLGAVREMINRIQSQHFADQAIMIIATGGFAQLFSDEGLFSAIIPELPLQGLRLALHKNLATIVL